MSGRSLSSARIMCLLNPRLTIFFCSLHPHHRSRPINCLCPYWIVWSTQGPWCRCLPPHHHPTHCHCLYRHPPRRTPPKRIRPRFRHQFVRCHQHLRVYRLEDSRPPLSTLDVDLSSRAPLSPSSIYFSPGMTKAALSARPSGASISPTS